MSEQQSLFELSEDWKRIWEGMPEFTMSDHSPHRTINLHFRSDEDVAAFGLLINQAISEKQKSLWFPEAKPRICSNKIYVDES